MSRPKKYSILIICALMETSGIFVQMKRFPLLQRAAVDLLVDYLREREMATKKACSDYIQTQLAYINTNNEDFIGFAK
jgi:hypothetical protein